MHDVFILTDETFDSFISRSSVPVLVDFWAPWCAPCRLIAPIVENISHELGEKIATCKVNIDEAPKTASRLGITSIPTLIVFRDGQPAEKHIGAGSKDKLLRSLNLT
jgi:thioredoxin 1